MRTRLSPIVLAAVLLLSGLVPFPAAAQTTPSPASSLIVKVGAGVTTEQQTALVARNGGTITSSIPALRLPGVSGRRNQHAHAPQISRTDHQRVRPSTSHRSNS